MDYLKRHPTAWFGLCAILLALPPLPGEARDGALRGPQQSGPVRVAVNITPPPTRHLVRVDGGLLSVAAHDVKLVHLLDELSRQAGFTVAPCVACDQRISLRFDRLPLGQGLSIVLRDQNYVMGWKYTAAGRAMPHKLWVLPQPATSPSAALAPPAATHLVRESTAHAAEALRLQSALSVGTPEDREEAAVTLGQRRDASAVAPLARALMDSDAQVRRAAIESLAEIGGSNAASALAVALRDNDPRIREAAVNALGDLRGPKAIALLRQAQRDATAYVKQAAIETLEQLQGSTQDADGAPGALPWLRP